MTGLLSLANELLESVSDQCQSLNDLKCFRLVCTGINQAVEKQLHSRSKLSINVNRSTLHRDMAKVVDLGTGHYRTPELVQHLSIGNLAPEYDPDDNNWIQDEDGRFVRPPVVRSAAGTQALEHLTKHLWSAMRSLKGLKSIEWKIHDPDLEWTFSTILSAFSTLECLDEVDIHADFSVKSSGSAILPLDKLPPLQKITARVSSKEPWRAFYEPLSKCIAKCENLKALKLDTGHYTYRLEEKKDEIPVFNDLLEGCSASIPLTELALQGWRIKTDPSMIDRLRNVKTIASCTWHGCILDQNFLASLHRAGVCLTNVDTNSITSEMLDYIGSYSGIRSLDMGISFEAHPMLYQKFYEEVLPRQRHSLETLAIKPYYEGRWCFDEAEGEALASCPNLREITLTLNCNLFQTLKGRNVENSILTYAPIKSLLDAFAFHPSICVIRLTPAGNPADRDAWCGNGMIQYEEWCDEIIAKCLEKLAKEVVVEAGAFHQDFRLSIPGKIHQVRAKTSGGGYEWRATEEFPVFPF